MRTLTGKEIELDIEEKDEVSPTARRKRLAPFPPILGDTHTSYLPTTPRGPAAHRYLTMKCFYTHTQTDTITSPFSASTMR